MTDTAYNVLEPPPGPRVKPVDVRLNDAGEGRQVVLVASGDNGPVVAPASDAGVDAVRVAVQAVQAAVEGIPVAPATDVTALAKDTTLVQVRDAVAAVQTAVEGIPVTPATDVSALGREATALRTAVAAEAVQASTGSSNATLSAINAKVGIPTSDDLLSLLRSIATNTSTEVTRTDSLELTAEQIQLNTDTLESVMGTVSSRLGTTATPGSIAALTEAVRALLATPTGLPTNVQNWPSDPTKNAKLEELRVLLDAAIDETGGRMIVAGNAGATLARDSTLTSVATALTAATPTTLPGASALASAATTLLGFSARETTGTASAVFRLRATDVAGAIMATVSLAPGESTRDWYGPNGIAAAGGVYFELVAGAVAGGVQTR